MNRYAYIYGLLIDGNLIVHVQLNALSLIGIFLAFVMVTENGRQDVFLSAHFESPF